MALPPLVTVDDLEARLGTTIGSLTDQSRAGSLLDGASAFIRAVAGLTWETVPVPDVVKEIALSVTARAWHNPSGFKQRSLADASWTYSDDSGMYLTPAERRLLVNASGRSLPAAFTIDPTPTATPIDWFDPWIS